MAFNRERALASAAKYAGRGQHDRAAREYQAIVEADPSDIRSWVMLADCLVRAGDTSGAIDRFSKVADFYAENDEPTKAIAVYRQILSLDASRLDIHLKIAERLHAIGRTPDAIATYEFVAQSFFQAGKVAEGLEGFRMVAELDVGAVAKRLRVAELYSREGRKEAAVEHFRLAAQRLLAKNRYDDYIRVAERLLYHKDDDADILRSLAELYLVHAKEPRRALMKLNGLLRVSPSDPLGLELLADTFVALGKKNKAISVAAELAKDLRKGDAAAKQEAARILKKALAWSPESPDELRKALAEVEGEIAALGGGEPEVLIDVADDEDDDLDLDVDIDEDGDDFDLAVEEEVGDDGYDVSMTAAEKLVLETRVYIRYKMYEHALVHVDGLLDIDPSDLEAIELKAEVLDRMGRLGDAADLYVHLAQLVGEKDPGKAERFLDQAVALVPDHAKASMMMTTLEAVGRGGSRRPAASKSVAEPKPEAKPAQEPAQSAPSETEAVAEPAAAKAAEEAAPKSKPLFGGRTPLPSLLPKREGRTPLPGRVGTPLPGLPPRREVTPAPGVLGKRDEEPGAEAPVTTDDSGLLRFSAPKKRPPPPPPGRGRRRTSESRGKARGRDDDDTSEGDSETSRPQHDQHQADGVGGALVEDEVEELDDVELIEADDLELVEADDDGADDDEADAASSEPGAQAQEEAAEASSDPSEPEPDAPAASEEVADEAGDEAGDESSRARPRLGFLPTRGRSSRRSRRRESAKNASLAPRRETAGAETDASGSDDALAEPASEAPVEDAAQGSDGAAVEAERSEGAVAAEPEAGDASTRSEAHEEGAAETADAAPVSDGEDASEEVAEENTADNTAENTDVAKGDEEAEVAGSDDGAEGAEGDRAAEELSESVAERGGDAPEAVDDDSPTAVDDDSPEDLSSSDAADEAASEGDEASEAEAASESDEASEAEAASESDEAAEAEATSDSDEAEDDEATSASESDEAAEAEAPAESEASEAEAASESDAASGAEAASESDEASESDAASESDEASESDAASESEAPESEAASESEAPESDEAAEAEAASESDEAPQSEASEAEAASEAGSESEATSEAEAASEPESEPATPQEIAAKYPEIQDELEELLFFITQGFDDDAAVAYMELVGRHPGHPALEPYAERFASMEEPESDAAAPVVLDDGDGAEQELFPEGSDEPLEAPLFDFEENDEEDDFLSSIFDEEPAKPAKTKSKDPPRARAELEGNADARTLFDLGTAYREMGLIDDALAQFRAASRDSDWKARSLVMMASLHLYRGELPEAIADLEEAVAFAVTDDERSEARYELGVIYQVMGETEKAIAALEAVNPGYRDRDDRLAALASG